MSTAASLEGTLARMGFAFADLYDRTRLPALDASFLAHLKAADSACATQLLAARAAPDALALQDESALILALAPHLERFLEMLFGIGAESAQLAARHHTLDPLYAIKRNFVQRRASTKYKADQARGFDGDELAQALRTHLGGEFDELRFAVQVTAWLQDEAAHRELLDLAMRYAAWALHSEPGKTRHAGGVLFKAPVKIDPLHLVRHVEHKEEHGATALRMAESHLRQRQGFTLTDEGMGLAAALDNTNYCIWCHKQGKDSCSKGLHEKADPAGQAEIVYKKSPFGVMLAGCPLEEKISEFQLAKTEGLSLAALAIMVVDNPMVAATGHRICNDCMKACIYQKQEPVNIPQAETRTLKDVLELPWGFEIYSLLTRWNPLNLRRPLPLPATGHKVLVVGLGPAGFSLAHHLMNEGHTVVGIDGLKIEPLPGHICGVRSDGSRRSFEPVRDFKALCESLDARVMAGFGGVAEYGITVRWDKNFLKVVRLLIERRSEFAMIGGVRFGGTLTQNDAFAAGFDHIALCMGAGKPTTLDIPHGLARGVRTASDFLMALQLTGAAKESSLANMQLRLPVVVIGGGLTAIDTATESLAYYVVQVEKFLHRYSELAAELGEHAIRDRWDGEEREIAEEFLAHARAIRNEREQAGREGRRLRIVQLLQHWGGVTIAYRRRLIDSPAYTLNHEEVEKALEEGIVFAEGLAPLVVEVDDYGAVSGMKFTRQALDEHGNWQAQGESRLAANTVFIAAGTQPNTVLAREDTVHFQLDGKYFRACDEEGMPVKPRPGLCKPERPDVLLSKQRDGRFVSFFGDLHPSFSGNVVKALASTKQGFPVISRVLAKTAPASALGGVDFMAAMNDELRATVHAVERLTPTIVEVVIRAPRAARNFQPGQFYRLQNFEALAPLVGNTRMQMESLAVTGAWVDKELGLISTIVLEMGGSSDLCAILTPGEPVVLMGPTGTPTHIEPGETVLLAGGGLGNAVLFSIGQAFRAAGSKVLYFAGYKEIIDRYKIEDIKAAADTIVWCCDEEPGFQPDREQDHAFVGNIVQAMEYYAAGRLGACSIRLADVNRIIAIGSDRMMAAVGRARHGVLEPYLNTHHFAIGSINSPMQCMMKEICAQCLQAHRDPATGKVTYVFSCFNQDQPLDCVDFGVLADRLKQNSLQEKLTAQWLRHCRPGLTALRTLV